MCTKWQTVSLSVVWVLVAVVISHLTVRFSSFFLILFKRVYGFHIVTGGYRGGFSKRLPEASSISDRAKERPRAGQCPSGVVVAPLGSCI